ncbi:MAG TPA: hypothetical protein VFV47_14430 [Hyphomicrobiaceae bacterium]|nr:hypothetical protein [Hyphomicrobiaceae bacterium]
MFIIRTAFCLSLFVLILSADASRQQQTAAHAVTPAARTGA